MEDNDLSAASIRKAVEEISAGLVHARLGNGLYKQRIARPGQGKSGGFRTILIVKFEEHAFFLRGFAKNEQDNLSARELKFLKDLAKEFLRYDQEDIDQAIKFGALEEVKP